MPKKSKNDPHNEKPVKIDMKVEDALRKVMSPKPKLPKK